MGYTRRGRHVLGALAGIALLGPGAAMAQAQGSGSSGGTPSNASATGGPGTLGTEVPNDSALAQGYYHSRTQVDEEDRQLEEGLRQLLQDNRTAMEQAKQAAASGDPAAQEIVDAREIVEFNLLKGAQESGFALGEGAEAGFAATGSMGSGSSDLPSYATVASAEEATESTEEATADASTDTSSESTGSSEDSMESGSTAGMDVQEHASTADDLLQQARDANRHQLASLLEHAQKALNNAESATATSSVGSASP